MAALAGYALPGVVTRKTRAALEADAAAADATPAPSAAEPVTTAQAGPAESDDTGVTRRHPVATHEEQAVVASGSTATAHNGAYERAADETPGGASGAENGYSSGNATQPSTTPTTTAPVTGRRRTGGLLSMLRR
jgi:hypothetical protein